MEPWFAKSILATAAIVPAFLAIPVFKARFGVDPLVFLVWYFGATAASIALVLAFTGRAAELLPGPDVLAAVVAIGLVFGALANGALFQAIGLAPNPGLPPVIYASASLVVFALSALLAASLPGMFRPVSTDLVSLAGVLLVLSGLYLLATGRR